MNKEKSDLKVGFITELDPSDKRSWSGIHYRMSCALKTQFSEVVNLGPVRLKPLESFWMLSIILLFKVVHLVRYNKKIKSPHFLVRSKMHSRYFERKLKLSNVDVLFAPVASIEIAYLNTDIPICYFSDTTFGQFWDYYHSEDHLSPTMRRIGNQIEQFAINRSTSQVFSSKWAASYAKKHYGAQNIFVTKMGANLDIDSSLQLAEKRKGTRFNLLFIGVDWQRKGGPIVFEVFEALSKKGHNVSLTVCGCTPSVENSNMTVIPFLDKNNEDDMLEIKMLYSQAHLFFMPTRAETYGIVFCEANAYGLPVVSTNTGGVSSIIKNGYNGFLLPEASGSKEYEKVIERLIVDQSLYQELSINAKLKYEKELNWGEWSKEMREIIHKTMVYNEK